MMWKRFYWKRESFKLIGKLGIESLKRINIISIDDTFEIIL